MLWVYSTIDSLLTNSGAATRFGAERAPLETLMDLTPREFVLIATGFGVAIVAFYIIQVGKRMRQTIAYKARRVVVGIAIYFAAIYICREQGYQPTIGVLAGLVAGLIVTRMLVSPPRKTRYIKTSDKRQLIERDLVDEEYDPTRHHFDHIVSLKKGGDSSANNLRVITKEANLKKGAKMPRLKDFL